MDRKVCFFIGHRDAPESVMKSLADAIERHIAEYKVTTFIVGHYGNFDRMAASALTAAKKKYPNISLLLLTPYHPFESSVEVPDGFNGTFYPDGMESIPHRAAIARANQKVISQADYLIAYAKHTASNASSLVDYAERKGDIVLTNLAKL